MKWIVQIARVLVGGLFIFSGLIKLNDPLGFSYKLGDYFAESVLNLPFLQPFTLELALIIVVLEVLVGVALLLGFWRRITVGLLVLMIVFFTFLTFYSAYFNKVTDCGCFGDAIPLTPWQSFYKDLVLLVLIGIIYAGRHYIRPLLPSRPNAVVMVLSLLGCGLLGNYVLRHLPILDFRPYAEGLSIVEGRKSAEELGRQGTEYATMYSLKNTQTGEEREILSSKYVEEQWWTKKEWKILEDKSRSVMVQKGYEPPIHDFVISLDGREITEEVLANDQILLVISYKMEKADDEAYKRINKLAKEARNTGIRVLGLSASLPSIVQEKKEKLGIDFPIATMDETVLKTIVRSNPGLVLLREGTVAGKWHHLDTPRAEKLASKNP